MNATTFVINCARQRGFGRSRVRPRQDTEVDGGAPSLVREKHKKTPQKKLDDGVR